MSNMRVDFKHIQNMIDSLEYKFTVVDGTTITFCVATLPNGFVVGRGESACVDPNNFDKALGEKFAQERAEQDAINKLWELEGYLLKVTGKTSDEL